MGRGEARRGERGGGGRWARIIDDLFVCFAAKDFESIAACVILPKPCSFSLREEIGGRMWKMFKKLHQISAVLGLHQFGSFQQENVVIK